MSLKAHKHIKELKPISPSAAIAKELLRRQRYEQYKKYPLLWAYDILGEHPSNFKWSAHGGDYVNHIWDGSKDPLAEAWNAIANNDWVAVPAATGTAKTFWLARLVMWYLDCFEDSLIVTSAPKESQLSVNLWSEISKIREHILKVRPYMRITKLNIKIEGNNPNISKQSDSWEMLGFVAGVGANEESATKAQGFHRKYMLIVCEEMAGMNPAVVTAFKNTAVASTNVMVGVGNPDSELDELAKFSEHPRVKTFRISGFDFPNIVLNNEIYPGAVSNISIQAREKEYGVESPMYQSRVRGITPKDAKDSLIYSSWIDKCDKYHGQFNTEIKVSEKGKGVGIDVANSEAGDKAAVARFKGNTLDYIKEFQCPNATDLAYNFVYDDIELQAKKCLNYGIFRLKDFGIGGHQVGVDNVGVGVATLNALHKKGYPTAVGLSGGSKAWAEAIPVDERTKQPIWQFPNLRNQMMWELREDIREGRLIFDIPDRALMRKIKSELAAIKFKYSGNMVTVESKEDLKKRLGKSPNILDSIAYANFMRKGYRVTGANYMPFLAG